VSALLTLVDQKAFRRLFIDELGWYNPDRASMTCDVDGRQYALDQVAQYKGLRIWVHGGMPERKVQREIDRQVGRDNLERLVIFAGSDRQEWRWPRRGVNAKLVMHRHMIGQPDEHLERQLRAIEIDFDSEPSLIELLSRMRAAFDVESANSDGDRFA